jgi:hypothetical protein
MQLTATKLAQPFRARATRPARRHARLAHHAAAAPKPLTQTQLTKDRAFYSCSCGYAWTTAVTTSVGCPHCGTEQAW